ncbi:3'-5'-exoribonuclease [Myotisia sp. PD_48]|nr:3'-5'-exoribonuclease [Myotisia sp. PD_48]
MDKRRINGPPSGTIPPVYTYGLNRENGPVPPQRPLRARTPKELRKIYLTTGVIPSASGSAYFELQPSPNEASSDSLVAPSSSLKLLCSVNGPKPLPRSAPFSPNLLLSTHVKYAPFASRRRRGYIRDMTEKDLGVHLENALRGAIISDRWPKSGLEVTVTILEGEDDRWWGDILASEPLAAADGWGMMNVLASCITVASAAIADARVDCLDLVAGGVAALVEEAPRSKDQTPQSNRWALVLDPDPAEHRNICAVCVVGYMPGRDEITELWLKGELPGIASNTAENNSHDHDHDALIDGAVAAAKAAQLVLIEAAKESPAQ